MAREMGDNGEAFRARITSVTTNADGSVRRYTHYQGPYATAAAAKSRITWAERMARRQNDSQRHYLPESRYTVTVEAVVERAATNWEPVS